MKRDFETSANDEHKGKRIDKFLSDFSINFDQPMTRTFAAKILSNDGVLINGRSVTKNYKLVPGDFIKFSLPKIEPNKLIAQNIPINIVYEDNDLLVVNKPKGMVVHPGCGNPNNTLANALFFHCKGSLSKISGELRLGIVHRIDKDTSGLLIVAKNDYIHQELAKQIKSHSFLREYEAVVHKNFKKDFGKIEAPIGRDHKNRKRMAVTLKNSKHAVTYYKVLKNFKNYSYIRLKLETGRTHQIRVHMAKIGHPVVGDLIYGSKNKEPKGQCLHAKTISFIHPRNKKELFFTSKLPEYFSSFLKKIKEEKL